MSDVIVAWSDPHADPNKRDLHFRGFDRTSVKYCGKPVTFSGSRARDLRPAIASRYSGGSSSDEALIVFVSEDPSYQGAIEAQRIKGIGGSGPFAKLGGGCGLGGSLSAAGAFAVGSRSFTLSLKGVPPAAKVGLFNIAAGGSVFLTCGPCAITQPTILIPVGLAQPFTKISVSIPCGNEFIGADVQFQAFVLDSGTTPCSAFENVSISNRIRGTVGQ